MLLGAVPGLLVLGFWVYCLFDVITSEESTVRNLPKMLWLLLVLFIPLVGGVAWLTVGRPEQATFRPGSASYRPSPRRRPLAPDDNPEFLSGLQPLARPDDAEEARRLREWEADLRRREEELRRHQGDDEAGPDS